MLLKSQPTKIIQIVPQLPPLINGLGDYALNLARELRYQYGMETKFLIGDPTWQGTTEIDGFTTQSISQRSFKELLADLSNLCKPLTSEQKMSVLLHYVGYGYSQKGCPVWLVKGLEHWKKNASNARLVTMFHEVYASGKPWTSAFWLSPLQRNLAARIAQLSDHSLTSKQLYAERLSHLSRRKDSKITTLPVFSNIGEPDQVLPLDKRDRRLVVFGSPATRKRVYQESLEKLHQACKLLKIEEIWDIGTSTGLTLSTVNGVPVVEKGEQPAEEISHILLNSFAGFFDYPTDYLAKSTIFAAYCAHGVLPVSAHSGDLPVDGIQAGKHYSVPNYQISRGKNMIELQAIADDAYAWYQTHNLSVQSKLFLEHLIFST